MSYYGNYRTELLSEIFPDFTSFQTFYTTCGVPNVLLSGADYANYGLSTIYFLLMSKYANSHVAASDSNRAKLDLMARIFQYAPAWQRRMALQAKLRALSDADLINGGDIITNRAEHPANPPATDSRTALTFIDGQTATLYNKEKQDAYARAYAALDDQATSDFLAAFRTLFIIITAPTDPLWYANEED